MSVCNDDQLIDNRESLEAIKNYFNHRINISNRIRIRKSRRSVV